MKMIAKKLTARQMMLATKLWEYHQLTRYQGKADLIVGLGSYSTKVAEHAAELYLGGAAPAMLFTGGYGNWTDDAFSQPEAEIFRSVAISLGVPKEKIHCENSATNTGENILFSRDFVKQKNIQHESVLFVSKPNMMRRCYATCKQRWPEIQSYFTSPLLELEQQAESFHGVESIVNEIVGDVLRISEYPKLGFQIPQTIPDDIWSAYNELVSDGFNKHLPV